MPIDIKDIDHKANLARLEFSDKEKEKIKNELNTILTYVEKLKEVDVHNVEPTLHVIEMVNVFREDVIKTSLDREKTLMNAPEKKAGCFSIPRVLE